MGSSRRRGVGRPIGVVLASTVLFAPSACASGPATEVATPPASEVSAPPASSAPSASEAVVAWPGELSATSTEAMPPPSASEAPSVRTIRAYITGYSYFDNTPPGSARIAYPIRHTVAGGRGTYDDPVTVAVGYVRDAGVTILDWPSGTRFYVPNLRRYLIVEDTCGDGERPQDGPCHTGYPAGATAWLDVWVGGEGGTPLDVERCMRKITGVWTVIVDPEPGYAVDPGDIYSPDRATGSGARATGCTETYGDEIHRP